MKQIDKLVPKIFSHVRGQMLIILERNLTDEGNVMEAHPNPYEG